LECIYIIYIRLYEDLSEYVKQIYTFWMPTGQFALINSKKLKKLYIVLINTRAMEIVLQFFL
jgi:hypothetical protein